MANTYEIAVVALFISEHGSNVAQQYLEHEHVEAYKAANEHQAHYQQMGHEPLTDKEFHAIELSYQQVLAQYGSSFRHDYGWAAAALNSNRPTFRDLERDTGLEKWRPYYKMASNNVHAGTKGITSRLGLLGAQRRVLMAGASNAGFTEPAQGAAISLLQTTISLSMTKPNMDVFVRYEILTAVQDEIGKTFLEIQNEIEAEEAGK